MKERLIQIGGKIKGIRAANRTRHTREKWLLVLLFPIFMILVTELNQMQDVGKLVSFFLNRPSVFAFDVLFVALVFGAVLLLLRQGWLAMLLTSLVFYIMSCVEYFKYLSSATHFSIVDMAMTMNVSDIANFTVLKPTPILVLTFIAILAYPTAAFLLNVRVHFRMRASLASGVLTGMVCLTMLFNPLLSGSVYAFFDVDTQPADNMFTTDRKFEQNNLIAHIAESISEQAESELREPDGYSPEQVDSLMVDADVAGDEAQDGAFISPNVIVITSESFGDFRRFKELAIPDDVYAGYDKVASEGYLGRCIVPTFGGYTVRTEFEMMFGLPVNSLSSYEMPQMQLKKGEQITFADYYKNLGYSTTYMHPYSSTFYSRDKIYSQYGFDKLLFIDDLNLNPDTDYFRRYVDDDTLYGKIADMIEENDDSSYIYTMTMQNHKPYADENGEDANGGDDELQYYLDGVKHSSDGLAAFVDELRALDEPTVLFFMGDHFPYFSSDDNIYAQVGIDSTNCDQLYNQEYIIWSNFDLDYSQIPEEPVSAFYLEPIITRLINAPQTDFTASMLEKMKTVPVYTETGNNAVPRDEELDVLTYDRTKGDQYSYEDAGFDKPSDDE